MIRFLEPPAHKVFVDSYNGGEWEAGLDRRLRAIVVWLILNGKTEKALGMLADKYDVDLPKIEVGLPKRRRTKAFGCYSSRSKTISVLNSDTLKDPFVVLHEFYHHLRTTSDAKHRGTEKHADRFAKEFIEAYKSTVSRETGNS